MFHHRIGPAKCSASSSVAGGTPECFIVTTFSGSKLCTSRRLFHPSLLHRTNGSGMRSLMARILPHLFWFLLSYTLDQRFLVEWYIFLYPRRMLDCGDGDWREVFFLEMSVLHVIPSKSFILDTHKLMHELALFGSEEIFLVYLLNYFFTLLGVSSHGLIFRWVGTQLRHVFKRISLNLAYNPELRR